MKSSHDLSTAADARRVSPFTLGLLFFLCAPWGLFKLWRGRATTWLLVPYALLGLPVCLGLYALVGIVGLAAFLPPLDLSVSPEAPRTVRFKAGNYESTFLETAHDTHGAHEFIRVQIQPGGGNEFHYHRNFDETFTAVEGELTVFIGDQTVVLRPGESKTARRGMLHTFKNQTDRMVTMTVKVAPARGLEKSIRVVYGLSNTDKWSQVGRVQRMWWIMLMLGYSETYFPEIPPLIQEPLVNALARIAQWRGEDAELKEFFGPAAGAPALAHQ